MRVLVLNGPNLDLLGTREPTIYGTTTLSELDDMVTDWGSALDIEVTCFQSNHEGELIEAIHDAGGLDGLVINAGALTHTSRAIGDAIAAVGLPAVEVHISNVKRREPWRAMSLLADSCVRTIYGRGVGGYQDALRHLRNRTVRAFETMRYGPDPDNLGDLRLPDSVAEGIIMVIHGGLWRQEHERDITETLAVDLTGRGYATLNIEYRRLGSGGGWPASAHDVLTAFDWITTSERWGGSPLALIGHSAGGHLGLWVGARRADRLALAVGLAPITDLDVLAASGRVGSAEAAALLEAGAPASVEAIPGKTLLVHGESDEIVPVAHSSRLGTGATVEIIPRMGHFHLLDPHREHWPKVVEELGKALR